VQEEKKPGTGIFAKAKEGGIATPELAKRLVERTQELMEEANAGALGPPETRSFRVRTNAGMKPASQEHNMAREDRVQPRNEHATSTGASPATTTSSISSKRSWAALVRH